MHQLKTQLLSSTSLALLASLFVSLGCSSSSSGGGAAGTSSGGTSSGGTTADGGTTDTGGSGTATGGTGTGGSGTATGGTGTGGSGTAGGMTNGGGPPGLGGTNDGNGGAAGHVGTAGNLRITPLGDSTTSDGCFRADLAQMLTAAGHTNFTFVGTRMHDPGCTNPSFPTTNGGDTSEGHGGYIVSDILKTTSTGKPGGADTNDPFTSSSADLALWFDGNPTDVVLMNFGTNDVSNNIPAATIINAFTAILTKLRSVNPNVRMLVAEIPPIAWVYCTFAVCDPRVRALNTAIVAWAAQQSTPQSPVVPVDQYTGYNDATDTQDGVHAAPPGSLKLATNWYNALLPAF